MAKPLNETSVFDIESGLEWPTDALAQPDSISKVEHEHEFYAVAHPAPVILPESGLVEVDEREQVPDTGQPTDIARALKNFQELERIRFRVTPHQNCRENIIDEDPYASEDESMEDEEISQNPRCGVDLKVGSVAELLHLGEFSTLTQL